MLYNQCSFLGSKWDVIKYKQFACSPNLCNSCISVSALLLLSCMHSLGLRLDLGNSLDQRGESSYTTSRASEKKRIAHLTTLTNHTPVGVGELAYVEKVCDFSHSKQLASTWYEYD